MHGKSLSVFGTASIASMWVTPYLDLAARHGMRILAVTETHIHADYLSGTRELTAATGATA